jgi:hypothetical protein
LSRAVIRDIVIPIVERTMWHNSSYARRRATLIQDPNLEMFMEEEMRRYFGVIGANECQHLREQLEEAYKNDPYAFEQLVKHLLRKFVKLSIKVRSAKKSRESRELGRLREGPPDRFSEMDKRSNLPECYR